MLALKKQLLLGLCEPEDVATQKLPASHRATPVQGKKFTYLKNNILPF